MAKKRTAKAPVIKRMDRDAFWKIIDWSSERASGDAEQREIVHEILLTLTPQEIIEFERHAFECLVEAYRWDLWAVAYIINGGCSDDGFLYFRCWLLAQGRKFFEAALKDPPRAADGVEDMDEAEGDLPFVIYGAYQEKTGEERMPGRRIGSSQEPDEPKGKPWDEDELPKLYPDLWRRFFGDTE